MATKPIKTRCNGTMTESAWLAWVRSALRSKSLRWPPRGTALELARKPYKGTNKLQKWTYTCAICKVGTFKAKEVVVDHFPVAAGCLVSVEDIGEFCNNLFCETSNLRVLCNPCHDTHTISTRQGLTFEEARLIKQAIEICKKPVKELLAYLSEHGYSGATVSNADKRRKAIEEILRKGE